MKESNHIQKDHKLGIRVVLEDLQKGGYEIQSVKTNLDICPQIVARRGEELAFVVVLTARYSKAPQIDPSVKAILLENSKRLTRFVISPRLA